MSDNDDKYQRPDPNADDPDGIASDAADGLPAEERAEDPVEAPNDESAAEESAFADRAEGDLQVDSHERAEADPEMVSEPETVPAPVQKMPSKVPGYLGLLLGLCGLGLAGYLYYVTQFQDPLAPFEKRIDELATRAEANSGQVMSQSEAIRQEIQAAISTQSQQQSQQADALRSELAAQQDNLEAAQAALAESLGETIVAQPPSDRDWKLAEVEYLLRIANHRLLMERDALTAGQLLTTADEILAEVGDFSLFDVRARLADEILSLKSMTGTDLQGLYLQVEALKNNIKTLPLRPPEYMEANVAPGAALDSAFDGDEGAEVAVNAPTDEQSVWQDLGGRLSAFFQYRQIDGNETRRPLLSPDEAIYLEMNLRLMLERTQLALMRRNQLVYQQSLATAEEWIDEYLDGEDRAVVQTRGQIAELLAVELELPIPDISGSLKALEAVSRGRDGAGE